MKYKDKLWKSQRRRIREGIGWKTDFRFFNFFIITERPDPGKIKYLHLIL